MEASFFGGIGKVSGVALELERTPAKLTFRCPVVKALMEQSHTSRVIYFSAVNHGPQPDTQIASSDGSFYSN